LLIFGPRGRSGNDRLGAVLCGRLRLHVGVYPGAEGGIVTPSSLSRLSWRKLDRFQRNLKAHAREYGANQAELARLADLCLAARLRKYERERNK
jgi:hypothetical protein